MEQGDSPYYTKDLSTHLYKGPMSWKEALAEYIHNPTDCVIFNQKEYNESVKRAKEARYFLL